mgnify:CR=1 FL=1
MSDVIALRRSILVILGAAGLLPACAAATKTESTTSGSGESPAEYEGATNASTGASGTAPTDDRPPPVMEGKVARVCSVAVAAGSGARVVMSDLDWTMTATQLEFASPLWPAAPVRLVGALPLAPNQRLVTVEVGQGDERRWLVLGVTAQAIHTLHTMEPQSEPPLDIAEPQASFAQLLARLKRNP